MLKRPRKALKLFKTSASVNARLNIEKFDIAPFHDPELPSTCPSPILPVSDGLVFGIDVIVLDAINFPFT